MSWVIGSAEFLAGVGILVLAWATMWIAGKGDPTRSRLVTLPILVLVMGISGISMIMRAFGKL
jgi:hypothetical protein